MEVHVLTDRLGPVTVEEFEQMPDDGFRMDLVRGWVVREPPASWGHGHIAAEVIRLLGNHVRSTKAGQVASSETGFILSREGRTVRAPDAAFVSAEKLAASGTPQGFYPGPPDLAVEVVSPSNRWSDISKKVRDYLEWGTSLVWIIDPPKRTVTVHRSGQVVKVLEETEMLDGEDVLPGFTVCVNDLFDLG